MQPPTSSAMIIIFRLPWVQNTESCLFIVLPYTSVCPVVGEYFYHLLTRIVEYWVRNSYICLAQIWGLSKARYLLKNEGFRQNMCTHVYKGQRHKSQLTIISISILFSSVDLRTSIVLYALLFFFWLEDSSCRKICVLRQEERRMGRGELRQTINEETYWEIFSCLHLSLVDSWESLTRVPIDSFVARPGREKSNRF